MTFRSGFQETRLSIDRELLETAAALKLEKILLRDFLHHFGASKLFTPVELNCRNNNHNGSTIRSALGHKHNWQTFDIRACRLALPRLNVLPSPQEDSHGKNSRNLFTLVSLPDCFFQYLSSINPERYRLLTKHYDEIFLVLNGIVQNYYLTKHGKSCLINIRSHLHTRLPSRI